jgi:hypothetical protein
MQASLPSTPGLLPSTTSLCQVRPGIAPWSSPSPGAASIACCAIVGAHLSQQSARLPRLQTSQTSTCGAAATLGSWGSTQNQSSSSRTNTWYRPPPTTQPFAAAQLLRARRWRPTPLVKPLTSSPNRYAVASATLTSRSAAAQARPPGLLRPRLDRLSHRFVRVVVRVRWCVDKHVSFVWQTLGCTHGAVTPTISWATTTSASCLH